MTRRIVCSGQPNRCATMSMPCNSANAAATYGSVHCTSFRSFRRRRNSFTLNCWCLREVPRRNNLLCERSDARIATQRIEEGLDSNRCVRQNQCDLDNFVQATEEPLF